MYPYLFVGLDVHRKSVTATAIAPDGTRVNQTRFGPGDPEIAAYLRSLPGPPRVVLEACCVWEHVYDAAASTGAPVTLAHPYKTRVIAEASLKSDKVDSEALANLLRLDAVPKAFAPEKPIRDLRQLVRDRVFYKGKQKAIKNHIYGILLRKGIPYEDGVLGRKRAREDLRSLGLSGVDRGLDALQDLDATCKGLDLAIREAFIASKEAQLLESIPGIGQLTAVALVAELCPIDRFPNVEKVCSYAALVPTNYQSGETSYHGRLKTDGNQFIKTLLVEAAYMHRRYDKRSGVSKLGRRVSRRRGKQKGAVAAARKLLKVVYAVLKRGTPYTPDAPERPGGEASPAVS